MLDPASAMLTTSDEVLAKLDLSSEVPGTRLSVDYGSLLSLLGNALRHSVTNA